MKRIPIRKRKEINPNPQPPKKKDNFVESEWYLTATVLLKSLAKLLVKSTAQKGIPYTSYIFSNSTLHILSS